MPNLFPENIVFDISQILFAIPGNVEKLNFSIVKSGDKVKIETLPPGIAPDKMVINVDELRKDTGRLLNILKIYKQKFDSSPYTDVANDLDYSIKELPKFINRLKNIVDSAAAAMVTDMFGNKYSKFRDYKYIEILFSQDVRNIISIRLLGSLKGPRGSPRARRFVIFNIPNEDLDINIINLVYKSKKIIENYVQNSNSNISEVSLDSEKINLSSQTDITNTSEGSVEFTSNNFLPPPPVHQKDSIFEDLGIALDILKDISPKTFDLFNAQNFQLTDGDLKEQLARVNDLISTVKYFQAQPLNKVSQDMILIKDLKTALGPFQCLLFLWDIVFAKLDVCQLAQELIKLAAKFAIDASCIEDVIAKSSLIFMFDGIDNLGEPLKSLIYLNLNNPALGLELNKALIEVQKYVDSLPRPKSKLKCKDPSDFAEMYKQAGGLSKLFKQLKADYPKNYGDIEKIFNENFSREIIIKLLRTLTDLLFAIDYCNFNLTFNLPTFSIRDLWGDFSFNLWDFLIGLLCELVSSILDILLTVLKNLNKIDDFLNQFMNDENIDSWQQYIDYAFYFLISSNRITTQTQTINPIVSGTLSTPEAISMIGQMNSSTLNPLSVGVNSASYSSAICYDNLPTARTFGVDIEYEIPVVDTRPVIQNFLLSQSNRKAANDILDKIKNFNYCEKYDFFTTKDQVEITTVDAVRQVSTMLPSMFEPDQPQNITIPQDKQQLSVSLKRMIEQIQSVLSKKEMTDLITGNYTEEVASVVRVIARINFPEITVKLDPIKYFTMLGKVVGRTMKDLKQAGVNTENQANEFRLPSFCDKEST